MVLTVVTRMLDYVMITVIIFNLSLRKYKDGQKKRFSLVLFAILFLLLYLALIIVDMNEAIPSWLEWVALGLFLLSLVLLRKKVWPWRLRCVKCHQKMSWDAVFGRDENLCDDCYYELHPEEKTKKEEEEKKKSPTYLEDKFNEECIKAEKTTDIDWDMWEPTERCVLTYVIDGDNILLILKKRGMGDGYYNGPGGHIELEETKTEAAIRETKEETGLDVADLVDMGTLYFQFRDGTRMIGYVFTTHTYSGTLIDECDETKPFWAKISELDYSNMWEDDRLWFPLLLEGKRFNGYFIFDDRKLVDSRIEELPERESEDEDE